MSTLQLTPAAPPADRRRLALLFALAAALLAQYCFTGEVLTHNRDSQTWNWRTEFTAGTLLLVVAVVAAWLAGSARPDDRAPAAAPARLDRRTLAALTPSALLYAVGLIGYLSQGETALVDAAWGGAILALLLPLAARSVGGARLARRRAHLARSPWLEWAAVGFLAELAFALRYWNLDDIPSHVDEDVALMGVHALELIDRGDYRWIGASSSQHLLAYDQLLAWSMRLFGADHVGLVTHSVVLGTLTVPLLYQLGRRMFGRRVGLIGAALLCVCYTHVHFSRILFGATPTFVLALVVLVLYLALRRHDPLWFALAGVLSGLNFALYDSARVIPVVCLAAFLWALATSPSSVRQGAANWGLLAAGALIAFGPMLAFALRNPVGFAGRASTVAVWSPGVWAHEEQGYGTTSPVVVLLQQAAHTFLTLHLYGDGSPHFAFPRPMVAATTAALFTLGLGRVLRRAGDRRHLLLLAWIGLTFVFGGVLTYDPPYWPHLNLVLPAVALVAALGLDALIDTLAPVPGTLPRAAMVGLAGATVTFTGLTNWQSYHAFVADNAGPRVRVARFIDDLPDGYRVYLVSDTFRSGENAFRFFNRGVRIVDLRPADLPSAARAERGPAVFILVGQGARAAGVTALHPGALVESHPAGANPPVFVSVMLDG